jgi:hypothetical protein
MGTNYYCLHKKYGKRHIGKLSYKWAFVFHGYPEYDFGIKSYDEWKRVLLDKQVTIISGESDVPIDKKGFLVRIEQSLAEQKSTVMHNDESWHDERGFAFLNREFS